MCLIMGNFQRFSTSSQHPEFLCDLQQLSQVLGSKCLRGESAKRKRGSPGGGSQALPGPDPRVLLPSLKLKKEDSF